ncbi:glycosyltransferase [Candidatus Marimicrobium litorale]|nr:glycosyltransferase [Candidatus Marimicrobium litorale]
MISRTQNQITNGWNETETIAVSVVCTTYNHELYVREALEGFLMQETDFPFEIIIHDDASTDKTGEIIQEYVFKYPEIIRPIFQSVNQYSKGGFKPLVYAAGFAKGKYVALCEGDDYWIAPEKLQTQVDLLEKNTEIDFAFHSALTRAESVIHDTHRWDYGRDRKFSLHEVIMSSRSFAPTCSYFFRRESLTRLPDWFFTMALVGDYYLEIFGSQRGGAIYTYKAMSVYRAESIGSWTERNIGNVARVEELTAAFFKTIPHFAEYLNCSVDVFSARRAEKHIELCLLYLGEQNFSEFRRHIDASFEQHADLSPRQRYIYRLRRLPRLLRFLIQSRAKLKSSL